MIQEGIISQKKQGSAVRGGGAHLSLGGKIMQILNIGHSCRNGVPIFPYRHYFRKRKLPRFQSSQLHEEASVPTVRIRVASSTTAYFAPTLR